MQGSRHRLEFRSEEESKDLLVTAIVTVLIQLYIRGTERQRRDNVRTSLASSKYQNRTRLIEYTTDYWQTTHD